MNCTRFLVAAALTACMSLTSMAGTKNNNFKIGRGTNVSHWLSQSTQRGPARDLHIQEEDFANLRKIGFDFVRLPIDEVQFWDEQGNQLPHAWQLLDNAVNWSIKHNLRIIVDLHIIRSHYFNAVNEGGADANTLFTSEKAQQQLIDMWRQLSAKLSHFSCDSVAYEFMNEPVADEHEQWNQLIAKVHKAIRKIEPQRTLVIGSNKWQGCWTMKYLRLPENDKNIILSFHYYEPFVLTHYSAWFTPIGKYAGPVQYPGVMVSQKDYDAAPAEAKEQLKNYTTEWNADRMEAEFMDAINVGKKYGLQVMCGEWGVYEPVDRELAYKWTADMLSIFKKHNISWCTWCYDADFGFWNQQTNTFKDYPLVELLMK